MTKFLLDTTDEKKKRFFLDTIRRFEDFSI